MQATILNLYNNHARPGRDLKGSHGESFLIRLGERNILLDTGWKPRVFLHNLKRLKVDPDSIDTLIISHGHLDHTGGLIGFLNARHSAKPLPLYAHADVREPKALMLPVGKLPLGFPKLTAELEAKLDFRLSKGKVEIAPGLFSLGEISASERTEKPGLEKRAFHKEDGRWVLDPVWDDLSLALMTPEGLVIITGCCHAGLLNTCRKARREFGEKIRAVIGGTHMMRYNEEEVDHVADLLESEYGTPELYLNHCTGDKAIERLKQRFGAEVAHDCLVGTEIIYQC